MELYKFNINNYHIHHNLTEFIKNLMNSYNDTLIIKIGISNNYDTTYLFNKIVMKYGGNYLLCDTDSNKIAEIKENFGINSQVYLEEPIKFINHIKEIVKNNHNYQKLKLHIIIDFYDLNLTPIQNANNYLNIYFIIKSLLISGSQILITNANNPEFINIIKKELNNNSNFEDYNYFLISF